MSWKWGKSCGSLFPVVFEAAGFDRAAQGDNGVSALEGPFHAGLFESLADDGFASGLDNPRAHKEALGTKLPVAHPVFVFLEVGDLLLGLLVCLGGLEEAFAGLMNDFFDFALVQVGPPAYAVLGGLFSSELNRAFERSETCWRAW